MIIKLKISCLAFYGTIEEKEPAQSALPYSVNLVGKVIPADEDNYSGDDVHPQKQRQLLTL